MDLGGRPIEYTKEVIDDICKKMEEYTLSVDIPIVAEFAYLNDIRRATLYEHDGFSYCLKKMMLKKEANLEREGLIKAKFTPMHAFSLKQLGWRDTQEIDNRHSFDGSEFADALTRIDTNTK